MTVALEPKTKLIGVGGGFSYDTHYTVVQALLLFLSVSCFGGDYIDVSLR